MIGKRRIEVRAYGVRVLLSAHPAIRKLKQAHTPSNHGNKLWTSSWILMDYLKRKGLKKGVRVMEVGCGWGLLGIYCAKKYGAKVTAADIDPAVLPYLNLHADINKVTLTTLRKDFNGLSGRCLGQSDVLVGADICFWDEMVEPLKRLIRRSLRAGVKCILIADPGRSPFTTLGDYFVDRGMGGIFEWTASRPRRIQGKILKIGQA